MARLPILMYHHVALTESEGLTIAASKLEAQFAYLASKGYQTHHFRDLTALSKLPQGKHVVITFDDSYVSQLELAYPLLQKYGLKATFFVPFHYIGATDRWNTASLPIMTVEQLQQLDPHSIELGYHSYAHRKYDQLAIDEVEQDTLKCLAFKKKNELLMTAVLAYPYGKYPKEFAAKHAFFDQLKKDGFEFGLRIGNRVNSFPFTKPYEIQRIDIRGDYTMQQFKWKLRFGKLF